MALILPVVPAYKDAQKQNSEKDLAKIIIQKGQDKEINTITGKISKKSIMAYKKAKDRPNSHFDMMAVDSSIGVIKLYYFYEDFEYIEGQLLNELDIKIFHRDSDHMKAIPALYVKENAEKRMKKYGIFGCYINKVKSYRKILNI